MGSTPPQDSVEPSDQPGRPETAIRLFGAFEVRVGDAALGRVRTRSVEWLLALLALRADDASRSWLAGTLWPESAESRALQTLRCNLLYLRNALGPSAACLLSPSPRSLRLDASAAWVDVWEFDACIRRGDEESLRRAVALHRGPLLRGCFEPWAEQERTLRLEACLGALETLAGISAARGQRQEAVALLRRAESLDPLRDSVQQELMRQLAAAGDTAAAVRSYGEFRDRLHRELNLSPHVDTEQLFREIRSSARSGRVARPAAPMALAIDPTDAFASDEPCSEPDCAPPMPLTALIGREAEVAQILKAMERYRLVTLTGIGGVGKTRLAIAAANALEARSAGKVAFVALAPITAPETLVPELVQLLGGPAGLQPRERLRRRLGGEPAILVLDNCEHLLPTCSSVTAELLGSCPGLRVLTTSRQALGISGEKVIQVLPLRLADLGPDDASTEGITGSPAEALFLERAAEARPGFRLEPGDAKYVAEICRRLDGIPLALELAAFRARVMGLPALAAGLAEPLRLLTRGDPTVDARHRTLRALIDSSYEQLAETERRLLQALSVIPAPWSLEAAEAALGKPVPGEPELPDLLDSLVSRSLLVTEAQTETIRFRMLEIVREYALDKLRETGSEGEVLLRVAEAHASFVERLESGLWGTDAERFCRALDAERAALNSILDYTRETSPALFARICGSLGRYWEERGLISEGATRLAQVLDREDLPPLQHARALLGAGVLAWAGHRQSDAAAFAAEAAALFEFLGDATGLGRSLLVRGLAADAARDAETAWELMLTAARGLLHAESPSAVRALASMVSTARIGDPALRLERLAVVRATTSSLMQRLSDPLVHAACLEILGRVAVEDESLEEAMEQFRHSIRLYEERHATTGIQQLQEQLGRVCEQKADWEAASHHYAVAVNQARRRPNESAPGWPLINLGNALLHGGKSGEAKGAYEEALALFLRLGDRFGAGCAFNNLGVIQFRGGDPVQARRLHERALAAYAEVGAPDGLIGTIERLAMVEAAIGNLRRAGRLLGAVEELRKLGRLRRHPSDVVDFEHALEALRARMSAEELGAELTAGRTLDLDSAVRLAISA